MEIKVDEKTLQLFKAYADSRMQEPPFLPPQRITFHFDTQHFAHSEKHKALDMLTEWVDQCSIDLTFVSVSLGIFSTNEFDDLLVRLSKCHKRGCKVSIIFANPDKYWELHPVPTERINVLSRISTLEKTIPGCVRFVEGPLYNSMYIVDENMLLVNHIFKKRSFDSAWAAIQRSLHPEFFDSLASQLQDYIPVVPNTL